MEQELKDKISAELDFYSEMNVKHSTLTEEVILKVIDKHQKNNKLDNMMNLSIGLIQDNHESIEQVFTKIITAFSGKKEPTTQKKAFDIEIEPKDQLDLEAINIGDKVRLKLGQEPFDAKVTAVATTFIEGTIISEMLFDEEHGAKQGDTVRFGMNHIFKHEPS